MAAKRITKELNNVFWQSLSFMDFLWDHSSSISGTNGKNALKWQVFIKGPAESVYAGGIFELSIDFPIDYPFVKPPKISFRTRIFHPNVSTTGEISLDELKPWTPYFQVHRILAAKLYKEDRANYENKARRWTQQYAIMFSDKGVVAVL